MMRRLGLALFGLLAFATAAAAQPVGQLPSGSIWANAGASRAIAAPTTVTAIIDRGIGNTQGTLLTRNATAWIALAPGSAGLPLVSQGASANLAYAVLGVVGGGTGNATLTNHGVLIGAGTSAITQLPVATSGTLLQGATGADPAFTATPTLGVAGTTLGTLSFANLTTGAVKLQAVAGALGSSILSLPAATDTLVGKATLDTFTNKTFDTAAAGNSLLINGLAATANTGTGAVVRATSPTLITPTLGVASATTINKVTITAPNTGATLTIAEGKTFTVSNTLALAGTDGTTWTGLNTNGTLMFADVASQTISGGATVTSLSQATGNITLNCGLRPQQFITNGGAFTITAPASDGSCVLLVTNNGSAGAITFSGFSVGSSIGDALTTTNTSKFSIHAWRINGTAGYRVAAHQ